MSTTGQVRWWGYPAWQVWPFRVAAWFTVAIGILFLLMGPPAVAGAIFLLSIITWFQCRTGAIAIGLDNESLYLRRLFLGRVERLPFSEVRRCLVLRGLLVTRLRIHGPSGLSLAMGHGLPMFAPRVRDWDGLLDALRKAFEPLGTWEDPQVW